MYIVEFVSVHPFIFYVVDFEFAIMWNTVELKSATTFML
jgi:hypothetical protein